MSGSVALADYLEELTYAAGPGAAKIASSVTASGRIQAETGFVDPQVPGPGLRAVLGRSAGSRSANAGNAARIPRVANRMARDALKQGAGLLSGDRT